MELRSTANPSRDSKPKLCENKWRASRSSCGDTTRLEGSLFERTARIGTMPPTWTSGIYSVGFRLVPGLGYCWLAERMINPMERLLREVEGALAARLYYLALTLTLALPDICGALEAEDGWAKRDRYKAWYAANLADDFQNLTADDCYRLRCGGIHQGRFGRPGMQYARAIFVLPHAQRSVFLDCIMGDAYFVSAEEFCLTVITRVRNWLENKRGDPTVQTNLSRLVTLHPDGLSPYAKGIPLIG